MNCPESSMRFDFIQKFFFWRWTYRENCPKDSVQGITEHTSLFFWVEPLQGILKDQKELLFRVSTWNPRASLTIIGPPIKTTPTRNKGIVRGSEAPHGPFIRPYWRTCDHLPRFWTSPLHRWSFCWASWSNTWNLKENDEVFFCGKNWMNPRDQLEGSSKELFFLVGSNDVLWVISWSFSCSGLLDFTFYYRCNWQWVFEK